jgi:SAM-dependent methyltransferase
MVRFDPARVRNYYDRHTPAFVALGEGRESGAIHRAVWGPGARNASEAIHYVDEQIAAAIQSLMPAGDALHVVDLGCGVAASLVYIADRLPIRGVGITLSPVQARLGAEKIRAARLSARLQCIEADFCALPASLERADAAFAIESFVHVADTSRFFDQCRELIRPGGLLIICDDFRADSALPRRSREAAKAAERAIEQFRQGWHVNALLTVDELRSQAGAAGFDHESTHDLSPYLRIGRPRDRLIGAFLGVLKWLRVDARRFDDLAGGHALQTCLRQGWIQYQLATFRRR